MNLNGKWLISFDEENWCQNNFGEFDTKEELMEFIKDTDAMQIYNIYLDETGDELEIDDSITFYIGKVIEYMPNIDAGQIIDNLSEQAANEAGEWGDNFLTNVSKEQENELYDGLNAVLEKWLSKHKLQPDFFNVVNVEEIVKEIEVVS